MHSRSILALSVLLGSLGFARAQQPAQVKPRPMHQILCELNKKSAIQKIQAAYRDPVRSEKGFTPIVWGMLREMEFRFKNFNELAEQIFDLNPEDSRWVRNSDPAGRATDPTVRQARIETIRKQLSMHAREHLETVAKNRGLSGLQAELQELFSTIRFSQGNGPSAQAAGETWTVTFKNAENQVVQFAFDARDRGAVALERSVGSAVTHTGMDAWKQFVAHLFDQEALKANLAGQSRSDDYAKFSFRVLEYLDTKGLWAKIGLGDDALKRLIGRGSPELIAQIGEATARATTRSAWWDGLASLAKRRPSRTTWAITATVGAVAMIAVFWDDIFGSGDVIQDRVARAIAHMDRQKDFSEFRTNQIPGWVTDRAYIQTYLTGLIEDGQLESVEAISQTIWSMGCDTATALNYFLLFNKDLLKNR